MIRLIKFLIVLVLFLIFNTISANVSLPAVFSDHMVLQQNSEVKIWGWGDPNEEITITTSWNNQSVKVNTNNQANWNAKITTPTAGGPFEITIQGYNKVIINDVLIGEVWLCSGQSNMQWTPNAGIDHGEEEIQKANYPSIRFFSVAKNSAEHPQLDLQGEWKVCTPETMKHFSAIGYFFGQRIHSRLNIPVGLINSSWGGSPAEVWTPKDAFNKNESLVKASKILRTEKWAPKQPSIVYNAMIHPIVPFKLAGVLWYQGETNEQNAATYSELFSTMITSWREKWEDHFPFYFAQIAPYKYGDDDKGVIVRDQQRRTLNKVDMTAMVVLSDIGNTQDIHPRNKIDVGIRFANIALNKTYGKSKIQYSGPLYNSFKVEKNKIRVKFDYAQGLSNDGKITEFEIAGEDGTYYPASAKIENKDDKISILVSSSKVKEPKNVRYGWHNIAEPKLTNTTGLPASSFTSEE